MAKAKAKEKARTKGRKAPDKDREVDQDLLRLHLPRRGRSHSRSSSEEHGLRVGLSPGPEVDSRQGNRDRKLEVTSVSRQVRRGRRHLAKAKVRARSKVRPSRESATVAASGGTRAQNVAADPWLPWSKESKEA